MMILVALSFFTLGLYVGVRVSKILSDKEYKDEKQKKIEEINKIYKNLLKSFVDGRVKFKTRVNQICHLVSEVEDLGMVEVAYFLDRKDIAIFKNGVCVYTSELVDKQTISNLVEYIESAFRSDITDVVNILGLVMSKNEFEKNFRIKFDDLQKLKDQLNISDVDDIVKENKIKFDIDEILDKISAYGIGSLTIEERLFLDNYSNEKRD